MKDEFRGKIIDSKGWVSILKKPWVYGSLLIIKKQYFIIPKNADRSYDDFSCEHCLSLSIHNWSEVIPETVGQFTSRLDEGKNKIWEHDLLQNESGRIFEVIWFNSPSYCGWDLRVIKCEGNPPLSSMWSGLEKIGNKFDSPELLEVEESKRK